MYKKDASLKLIYLVEKYLANSKEKEWLITIINDESRPGLPIRGVLEQMRADNNNKIDPMDKELIEDLLHFYG